MHEEVGGNAARIVPIESPLIKPLRVPFTLWRTLEEPAPVRIFRTRTRRDVVSPDGFRWNVVPVPEGSNVVHLADHPLRDHLFRLLIESVAAVLGSDLNHLTRTRTGTDELRALLNG